LRSFGKMIDKRKPRPKRFPLQYILHKLPRFGMSADHYKCSRYRLVVDTPLPSSRNRKHFMHIIHFRWPKAEVSWTKGQVMIELTKDRYTPAKGSWSEERERREDEQAQKIEALYDGSGSGTDDAEPCRPSDVCLHAVLYRPGRDPVSVPRPQGDGPRGEGPAGGEGERKL